MQNRYVRTMSLALTLLLGISSTACMLSTRGARVNDGRERAGSVSARQQGYDFAYRDGGDRGRLDRARTNPAYDFDSSDYRNGDRGYSRSMGDRGEYQQGYREGYKAGYDAGYKGR
jgi:hypothetical protein